MRCQIVEKYTVYAFHFDPLCRRWSTAAVEEEVNHA